MCVHFLDQLHSSPMNIIFVTCIQQTKYVIQYTHVLFERGLSAQFWPIFVLKCVPVTVKQDPWILINCKFKVYVHFKEHIGKIYPLFYFAGYLALQGFLGIPLFRTKTIRVFQIQLIKIIIYLM